MKRQKRDNLGETFHIATIPIACENHTEFTERAVEAAHEGRAVYNSCIRLLIDADDEDLPLRSGREYKGRALNQLLNDHRDLDAPWLHDISSNIRRSAAAQAHTAFGLWAEAQILNAQKLVRADDLRARRRTKLTAAAKLKQQNPTRYRETRADTLESVQKDRRDARSLAAKVDKYARRDRDPERIMRRRKSCERRERYSIPLNQRPVRVIDADRKILRSEGFGDIPLKKPMPPGLEPVSLTLVSRRKRRHHHRKRRRRAGELEWTAHIQYRRFVQQREVHPGCRSVGADHGKVHALTTIDNTGNVEFHHYDGRLIPILERSLERLRERREPCTRNSKRSEELTRLIGAANRRLTNLKDHQTLVMANAIVKNAAVVGIEDFDARNATRSAKGTNTTPGTNVQAKAGLNRALAFSRPGKQKAGLRRASQRIGAVYGMVPPKNTSRCCARCGHTAKGNRKSQAVFRCLECGLTCNADANASENVRTATMTRLLAKLARAEARRGRGQPLPAAGTPRPTKPRREASKACPETKTRRTNQ